MGLRLTVAAVAAAITVAPAAAHAAGLPTGRHVVLGRSADGRAIKAVRVGDLDSPRKALVVGAIHGDEPAGLRVTRAIRKRAASVHGVDVWVVDTVNPDGLRRGTRQNARGVDLNRNFPFQWQRTARGSRYYGGPRPFSEPESRVVRRWVLRLRPAVTVWYHQPWNAVLVPCHGKARIQRRYARRARAPVSCRGHELRGTATKWQKHLFPRTSPFVVELPPAGVAGPAANRHARAAILAAEGR